MLCAAIIVSSLGACSSDEPESGGATVSTESATLSFETKDPAAIVTALTAAGVQICNELLLPIPNQSYRFEDTRELTLTVPGGACHTSISDMEAEPSHGFLVTSSLPVQPRATTTLRR